MVLWWSTLVISAALNSQIASAEIADSGLIGWDGDKNGVIAHFSGGYEIRRDDVGRVLTTLVNFGIFDQYPGTPSPLQWQNASGYLPCLVTDFTREYDQGGQHYLYDVTISNFADMVMIPEPSPSPGVTPVSYPYVVVYTRIHIHNRSTVAISPTPAPRASVLIAPTPDPSVTPTPVPVPMPVPLSTPSSPVIAPDGMVDYDYVIVADKFGHDEYPWPSDEALLGAAGTWGGHYSHMQGYWDEKLSGIAMIDALPDPNLMNAYKAGYIYTQIVKDGTDLKVGEVYYEGRFDADKLGITATLLTIGDPDSLTYLRAFPTPTPDTTTTCFDGYRPETTWKYPWLWAIYLAKNPATISNEDFTALLIIERQIEHDRTGPCGIMRQTQLENHVCDYWTWDNWSALMGLASYKYVCETLVPFCGGGPCLYTEEATRANNEYNALLTGMNTVHGNFINSFKPPLNYLPISMDRTNPSSLPPLSGSWDANWALMLSFGRWAWDAYLLRMPQDGIELDMIDATYTTGLQGAEAAGLGLHNFGAYSNNAYSSTYNAGYGSAGLRGEIYRSEGIRAYQFMIDNGQSGPFCWWESFTFPEPTAWMGPVGTQHPGRNPYVVSCPHMWGQSTATKVLIDSLISLKSDGSVIIGRGVPNSWVSTGQAIRVANFPILNGDRMGFTITGDSPTQISLILDGAPIGGATLDLRAFKNNIGEASAGTPAPSEGTVYLPYGTKGTTVTLSAPPPVQITVSLPTATVNTATSNFTLPVLTSLVDPVDRITGFQGDFTFDSSVVTFQSTPVSPAGITASNWNVSANVLGTGTIKKLRITARVSNPNVFIFLSGTGTLFNLNMHRQSSVIGAASDLVWANPPDNLIFIDDTLASHAPIGAPPGRITIVSLATPTPTLTPTCPTPSPTPTATATATFTPTPTATATIPPTPTPSPSATPYVISGTISNCANPTPNPVRNVTMTLSGGANRSTTTDTSGNYYFLGLTTGLNYTVTPSRSGRASFGINTVDVIAVQRHFLNVGTPLSGCRLQAADVNGDTAVTTVDVIAIQRFFLGLSTGIANTGVYTFTPPSRSYMSLSTNQTNQNYDALIFGDVAQPWVVERPGDPSSDTPSKVPATVAVIKLPEVAADQSRTIFTTAVTSSAIDANNELVGFQGDFTFDERVVRFESSPVQAAGLTGGNWNVLGNVLDGPGPIRTLRVSAFSNDLVPLSGSGTLFNLNMIRVSQGNCTLSWAAAPDGFIFIDANLNTQKPGNSVSGSVISSRER